MRIRLVVPISVSLALVLAACGGSSGKVSSPSTQAGPSTTGHVAKVATNTPSISAQMICQTEAVNDIYASATGVKATLSKPTWVNHVYSCDYMYPGGEKMTLSVKEVSNEEETTSYFDDLATKLGKTQNLLGLGQGAFQVKDGSVVVRKDYKVLLIDVTKLPAQFGVPPASRGDVAINVAETIMGCWSGA